jgi:hypothetical protein
MDVDQSSHGPVVCASRAVTTQESLSMTESPPTSRRLAIAMTAAIASTTIAIGVTAASLLGWLRPVASPAAAPAPVEPPAPSPITTPSPVIYVPVTPAVPAAPPSPEFVEAATVPVEQLAMHEHRRHHESEREHGERDDD